MSLGNLTPAKGSIKNSKRIGRGNASGQGRTAGKGHKGAKSRAGHKAKMHFEGGQTPLARRLPKRGMGKGKFNHLINNDPFSQVVNIEQISSLDAEVVDLDVLLKNNLIKNLKFPVKVLGDGDIKKNITVKANMFSQSAIKKIEDAGGEVIIL